MGKLLLETFVQILTNSLDHSSDSCEMIFHNISVCQNITTQKETLCFLAHIYEHAMEHSGVNYCSPCSQVMLHWLAQLDIQTERFLLGQNLFSASHLQASAEYQS